METDKLEELIIKTVKKYPCLYDKALHEYKDSEIKNGVWKEISEITGYSVNECREVWTKLRNRLVQAIRRRMRKPSISDRWRYEDELEYLVPFVGITLSEDQTPLSAFPGNRRPHRHRSSRGTRKRPKLERISPEPERDSQDSRQSAAELSADILGGGGAGHPPPDADDDDDVTAQKYDEISEQVDDVDLFYLSIAAAAKRLPPPLQVRVRMKVCELVGEAQLHCFDTRAKNARFK